MDRTKYQYEGMKWLVELELLNHPQVINTLKLNIFMTSKSIKEVELLIYRENKSMLVLLELSWFGRRFGKQRIFDDVHEALSQLLPSFRFRVTDDPKIMDLAVAKVKQALTGGKYENSTNDRNGADQQSGEQRTNESSSTESSTGVAEGSSSNQEEQPVTPKSVLPQVGTSDSNEES